MTIITQPTLKCAFFQMSLSPCDFNNGLNVRVLLKEMVGQKVLNVSKRMLSNWYRRTAFFYLHKSTNIMVSFFIIDNCIKMPEHQSSSFEYIMQTLHYLYKKSGTKHYDYKIYEEWRKHGAFYLISTFSNFTIFVLAAKK